MSDALSDSLSDALSDALTSRKSPERVPEVARARTRRVSEMFRSSESSALHNFEVIFQGQRRNIFDFFFNDTMHIVSVYSMQKEITIKRHYKRRNKAKTYHTFEWKNTNAAL